MPKKWLSRLVLLASLSACGEFEQPVDAPAAPMKSVLAVSSSSAPGVVIQVYQALYGMAPGYADYTSYLAQASASNQVFASALAGDFSAVSDKSLALLVLNNLGITATTVTQTGSYAALLSAVEQIFAAYGSAARGQIILNMTGLLAGLSSDATFGAAAATYSSLVQANTSYSASPAGYIGSSTGVTSLKALASFPLGVAVSNTDKPNYNILSSSAEQQLVDTHFSQMTAVNIMKVRYLHPNNDSNSASDFTFTNADAFVDYAKTKSITIHGHALVWHSSYQVPSFITNWSKTADEFLTMLDTHVSTIVSHFAGKGNIVSWDVVNEAITDTSPAAFRTDSPFYIKAGNSSVYIERAFTAARKASADVELYYNDYNIEKNGVKMGKLEDMLTDFQARGIPITGVGFQMHVCLASPTTTTIAAALKRVVDKGLKVKISELDVAINKPSCDSFPANKVGTFTQSTALAQKKRYCEIVKAYLDNVPANLRGGITLWGTTDANNWLDDQYKSEFENQSIAWPLLFDAQYKDKAALSGFADALKGTTCNDLP